MPKQVRVLLEYAGAGSNARGFGATARGNLLYFVQ